MVSYDIGALRRNVAEVEGTLPGRLARYLEEDLVGVYLIGSMSGKFYPTAVNDMDVLIVPKDYTPRIIDRTTRAVEEVCRELQGPYVDLTHSFLKGPIKPKAGEKPALLVHCLVKRVGELTNPNENNRLVGYNWKLHNRALHGPDLKNIVGIRRIGLKNVLYDKNGIPTMRHRLKEMYGYERQVVGDEVLSVEARWAPTPEEQFESCIFTALATVGNVLEALHPYMVTEHYERPDASREFPHVFKGFPGADFPKKVWGLKEQQRRGELPVDEIFVSELTAETDKFLGDLQVALAEICG
ncbi:MAG TPA: hypothetical protein VI933_04915 [archaeon]|nr:hypothetical protein [archaeon]